MYNIYDLHTHSTASDGTLSPTELVEKADNAGVKILALTDHDTLSGLAEAQATADKLDIVLINGVEISVTWQKTTIHIVGLNIDATDSTLIDGLATLSDFRQWRAEEIGRKLDKAGFPGGYEYAAKTASGSLITRTHFARFLVEKGHAKDVRDVFKKFLVKGKPGFVDGKWVPLAEAVKWIKDAGGQAAIAHPARYRLTRSKLRRLIKDFLDAGGDALEVVSGSHSKDEFFTMAQHAKDFSMLSSAGSDYHGPENPWVRLGQLAQLPRACQPIWKDWEIGVAS